MDAGCWNFDGATQLPSKFSLARKPMKAVSSTPRKEGVLYDFGKETFGYITLKEVKGKGTIHIYYGESPEEALDTEYCETLDKLLAEPGQINRLPSGIHGNYTMNTRWTTARPSVMSMSFAIRE